MSFYFTHGMQALQMKMVAGKDAGIAPYFRGAHTEAKTSKRPAKMQRNSRILTEPTRKFEPPNEV